MSSKVLGPRCQFFVYFLSRKISTPSNCTIVKGDCVSSAGPYAVGDGSCSVIIIANEVCNIACPLMVSWISKYCTV